MKILNLQLNYFQKLHVQRRPRRRCETIGSFGEWMRSRKIRSRVAPERTTESPIHLCPGRFQIFDLQGENI